MPKIQFKRKKSTGIGTNKLSAGEPLYNLYDKKLYIGGNASSDETPSKHLTEVGVSSTGKVSIGAATNNDFTITAGAGISVTGDASKRTVTVKSNPTIVDNSDGATVAFTIDGKQFSHTVAVTIPGEVESAKKLTNERTITLAGDATGSVKFDGSQNVTLTADVKSADSAAKLSTPRTITLAGAVTGYNTFDGSANKTITTSYAIGDKEEDLKVVRKVTASADGKLTTTKSSLIAGDGVTITESAENNDITISSPTVVSPLASGSTEIAFSVNGQEYRKTITVEGVGMSVDSANRWTTKRTLTLAGDATGSVKFDGSKDVTLTATVKDNSHNHTISATGEDGLMDVIATGGTNEISIAVAPYTSQQKIASFDTSTTAPKLTTRLNYNGVLYATGMLGIGGSGTPEKVVLDDDDRLKDSREPKSHASSKTTYGLSSVNNYGHSKASSTSPAMAGTAFVGSETATFARGDHVHPTDTSRASSTHKHTLTTTVTTSTPSDTVLCSNVTINDGVLIVAEVAAARNDHTHTASIERAETSGPI